MQESDLYAEKPLTHWAGLLRESNNKDRAEAEDALDALLGEGMSKKLDTIDDFRILTATSSDEDVLTASASSLAARGVFNIAVDRIAENHRIAAGGSFADIDTTTIGLAQGCIGDVESSVRRHDHIPGAAQTGLGGAFGRGGNGNGRLPHGGVAGLLKTVSKECPKIRVRAIDVDPGADAERTAAVLIEELLAEDDFLEVGYENGTRRTLSAVPADRNGSAGPRIRLDAGSAFSGAVVYPFYDSLLVKVTAWARKFPDAVPP